MLPACRFSLMFLFLVFTSQFASAVSFPAAGARVSIILQDATETLLPLAVKGCGGAYFMVPKGNFRLTLFKQETTGRAQPVRAILATPDRQVIADVWLPGLADSGKARQIVTFEHEVTDPGIYVLNITAPADRYGNRFQWMISSNCPKFLLETSRGHKDSRHEEPLEISNPQQAAEIFFFPTRQAFAFEVTKLAIDSGNLELRDHTGSLILSQAPDAERSVRASLPADDTRQAPWQLTIPAGQAVLNLDHLTRWEQQSEHPNQSQWTTSRHAWFDFFSNRKLLHPYRHSRYLLSDETADLPFTVANLGQASKRVHLSLEFPASVAAFASLKENVLDLSPRESRTIYLSCQGSSSEQPRQCRLRVTADDFSTYSTVTLRTGHRHQGQQLSLPLTLTPYNHENEQFSYSVDYPRGGQPYFDLDNRPVIFTGNRIHTWSDGAWRRAVIQPPATMSAYINIRARCSKIAFDQDNCYYTIAALDDQPMLLHSNDLGATFEATPLPLRGSFDIEQFSGHNYPDGPPPLMCHTVTMRDPDRIWRRVHDVRLLVPRKENGQIILPEPVLVSRSGIGFSAHSGIPASLVSRQGKIHLIWAEATDPADKSIPGVPTYVATYDRQQGTLGTPALIGYGPPANDVHNTPCLTIDSQGYLHALIGTHGRTFLYARSLQPNTAGAGWSEAVPLGDKLSQTYVGLACDQNDSLQVAFRLANPPENTFPRGSSSSLSLMSKSAMAAFWQGPRQLVLPAFTDYCVYYHRLVIDRRHRLFLSYDYWSTYWFYRNDQAGSRRALMVSEDNGQNWRLAADQDLLP